MFAARLVRDKRMLNVLASVAVVSGSVTLKTSVSAAHAESYTSSFSPYSGVNVEVRLSEIGEDLEDEAKWEYKRKTCSFCRGFLESPCKTSFKTWSSCTEKAKESGVNPNTTCSNYSEALLACTNVNDDFFKARADEENALRRRDIDMRRRKYGIGLSQPQPISVLPLPM